MIKKQEPDKTRPCWVVMSSGGVKGWRGSAMLLLREYEWQGDGWAQTDTPEERPATFNKAMEKADWWGRLPGMKRQRGEAAAVVAQELTKTVPEERSKVLPAPVKYAWDNKHMAFVDEDGNRPPDVIP